MNFFNYLNKISLENNQKKDLKFFYEFLSGKHSTKLSSRIVALKGEAGIGKTHLAKKFVESLDIPIYYIGQEDLQGKNIKQFSSIRNLSKAKLEDNCLLYFDDVNYLVEETEYGEINTDFKRILLKIIAKVKSLPRAGMLITTNYFEFDMQIMDRIDIEIELESPNKRSKKIFLKNEYSSFLDKKQINAIAVKSIGYNFRDLDEVIRKSYRYGNGKFTKESIKTALDEHEPSNYRQFEILRNVNLKFKDVIGRTEIKEKLKEIMMIYKNRNFIEKFGLKRTNLIIFHGDPGLGKTYMAKALAGEIGFPLVNMNSSTLYGKYGPFFAFENMSRFAKRFKDSIVFIDEADKFVGKGHFDSEGPMQGMLNEVFDGIKGIKDSIVILAMNDITCFGNAFHDRFTLIDFGYPSDEERKEFFESKIKKHSSIFSNIDIDQLAAKTNRMSFREIEKIWNKVIFNHLTTKNKVEMSDFNDAISPYRKEVDFVYG